MTPVPQEHTTEPILQDDSIVISGMSGMYPKAKNIKEFADNLYNKENVISAASSRWNLKHPEVLQYLGQAPNVDRFDAQFFSVHYRLGHRMDPTSRKILEHSFQAIYDAGLSPGHFNGKKVAVFIGSSFSETEKDGLVSALSKKAGALLGANKSMFANRISYWLNAKGPSMCIDNGDGSSISALEQAFWALRRGGCEAAIVGGVNFCLYPHGTVHHGRLAMVSKDGKTKSFCDDGDGYVLSDAVNVILLQKAKDALRNYAEVVHVKTAYVPITSDEIGPQFGYYRNFETTAQFINDFYNEAQVSPQAVEYVEGLGTGIPYADKSELEAIAKVYCKDRQNTLLVGSVASNIGFTVASHGITGISKVLLGYYNGVLAANLNCERLRKDVPAIENGKMRIVTEHQPFGRTYTAVNGTSAAGVNSHVLLRGHFKPKDLPRYATSMPYLIASSGRQESNVQSIFDNLKSHPIDAEEIALLHNIHSRNISGHLGRGYMILGTDENKKKSVTLGEKVDYFDNAKRPLWFVYSGMGSQWAGMGAQLMRIPIFATAIERCRQILAPKGLDIVEIICSPDKTMFDNILHSFVGIAAIQIALTDLLRGLGLTPDGIIGHSVGELGCAYADGSLTADEMILAAYCRGRVSLETPLIRGAMAAVGLGYEQVSAMCPPEVDVACHNSSQSSTLSGPADVMRAFVTQLTTKGIFAKEVPCSNIAYHSRYIASAGPKLLKYLKEVIKNPKIRSDRWISTSVPQDEWHAPSAKYCSAEYHTNNLLKPVLFEEMCRLIPANAVLVEIAPHGLLQAILQRSMPIDCRYIALTRRGHSENVVHLLGAIGQIYMEGYALSVQALYPPVQFPVSTETPMLSHLVEWMHSEKWFVTKFNVLDKKTAAICKFIKSVHENENKYLQGHVITNKMCYPYAAALVDVWDMFAMHANLPKRGASIMFQDVRLHAQPLLFEQKPLRINVSMQKGTARFEVMSKHSRVMSGFIVQTERPVVKNDIELRRANDEYDTMKFTSKDIYQMLYERGCNYSGEFQSIECASESLNEAALAWSGNWVTFIDGLLQLNALRQAPDVMSLPTFIKSICINVEEHQNSHVYQMNGREVMQASVVHDRTRYHRVDVPHLLITKKRIKKSPNPIAKIYTARKKLHLKITTNRPPQDYMTLCGGVVLEYIQFNYMMPLSRGIHRLEFNIIPSEVTEIHETKQQHEQILKPIRLQSNEIGKFESLHWEQSSFIQEPKVTVTVHFAGLNAIDVKRASGIIPFTINMYGMDYSGVTNGGERVMGIVSGGAASSHVAAEPLLMWPVPEHWSLEDAATVPHAYAYAFYALVIKGNLTHGMSVLIHEAAEALSQAAVAIAVAYDCQLFVTVNNSRQKVFLQKRFPQLQEEHIGNARDITFVDNVLTATQGKGCDIVLSCLKGVFKDASFNCVSPLGVLIDTVQIQEPEDYEYGMFHMNNDRSYLQIDFSSIFTRNYLDDMKVLQKMLSDGISAGYVVPLSRVTYAPRDVQRAFKLLQKRQQIGHVLLRLCDNTINIKHSYRATCDPDKCQIVFWDNEVFGVQLVQTLIDQGAKNICVCCKKLSSYQLLKIRSWANLGIKFEISCEELTKDLLSTKLLNNALKLGSIEGIYIVLATAANDATLKDFASGFEKLDLMSRLICHQLKHFVIVSAINDLAKKMYLSRMKSGYTATWVDLSHLSTIIEITGLDVADTIKSAQCNTNALLVAKIKQIEQLSLVDQVIALADVNVTPHLGIDVSLQQLGLADENISLINAFLNIMYNLSLNEKEIPLLTLQKLRELENDLTDFKPPNVRGLSTFISEIYPDDLLATLDLVVLPTLSHKTISVEFDYDVAEQYLYIIPGIEGQHERFRPLCERLKIPALVLQPGLDHPHETAQGTAQRYFKTLSEKAETQDKFYILAYESGVMVALELAAILEDQGSTGTVFCLGCAPTEFRAEVEYQLSDYETEERLQDAVARHIYKLITGEVTAELDAELRAASSWARKVDACARLLLGRTTHSTQYVRALLEVMLARLQQARRAAPAPRALRSKLVVLRAASPRPPPHDAELQQLSHQPVAMRHLQRPLSCVVEDMQCAALINQYLGDDILQQFENKNLCECYAVSLREI